MIGVYKQIVIVYSTESSIHTTQHTMPHNVLHIMHTLCKLCITTLYTIILESMQHNTTLCEYAI